MNDPNYSILLTSDFEEPTTDADFEYLGRLLWHHGFRNPELQDARGWNKLFRKCMTLFTSWKREQ